MFVSVRPVISSSHQMFCGVQGEQAGVEQTHGLVKGELLQVIATDNTSVALVEAGRALRKVLGAHPVVHPISTQVASCALNSLFA